MCGVLIDRRAVLSSIIASIAAASSFTRDPVWAQGDPLPEMLRFNLWQEMRVELDVPSACLQPETAVIPDCRMQPHEWIKSSNGVLVKVDGNADGEGHFLPGPTDILWDLAGAIIEWNLNSAAAEYLLEQFQKHSSRVDEARLSWFLLAYSVLRLSYCKMARSATQDVAEKPRLDHAILHYKAHVNWGLRAAGCHHARRPPA